MIMSLNNHEHFVHMILFIIYGRIQSRQSMKDNYMKHVKGMTRYDTISEDTDACLHVRGVSQETMNLATTMKDMKSLNQLRKKKKKTNNSRNTTWKNRRQKKYPPERCGSGHDCLDLCVFQFVFDSFLVKPKKRNFWLQAGILFLFVFWLSLLFWFLS